MDRFSTRATRGPHPASPSWAVDEQSGEVRGRWPTDSSWSVRESFLSGDLYLFTIRPTSRKPPSRDGDRLRPVATGCDRCGQAVDWLTLEKEERSPTDQFGEPKIRAWHLNRRSGTNLSGLASDINAQVSNVEPVWARRGERRSSVLVAA